jgi:hypothetical protein
VSFLKKTHHAHIRWQGHKDLNARLNVLARGWGGKEEVGLYVHTLYVPNICAHAVCTSFRLQGKDIHCPTLYWSLLTLYLDCSIHPAGPRLAGLCV